MSFMPSNTGSSKKLKISFQMLLKATDPKVTPCIDSFKQQACLEGK
jgi:hypothetical protein